MFSIFRYATAFLIVGLTAASFIDAQVKKNPQPVPSAPTQKILEKTQTGKSSLVTVPISATDSYNLYVQDLRKEEVTIVEDGVPQTTAAFESESTPVTVVLLIDTNVRIYQKMVQLQRAVTNFTTQFKAQDRLKIIAFDDKINDLGDFTADRGELQKEISTILIGQGKKLYDAVALAVTDLKPIKGRRAIVLFTDGLDFYSDKTTIDDNRRAAKDPGIVFYTIRYDTRDENERIARGQAQQLGHAPGDLRGVLGPAPPPPQPGAPPPMQPMGAVPTLKLPSAKDKPLQEKELDPEQAQIITDLLDPIYKTADDYLQDMADFSGGMAVRADTMNDFPTAFGAVINDIRTQYSVAYYPVNHGNDGKYHKITISSSRQGVVIRSRPGYFAGVDQ